MTTTRYAVLEDVLRQFDIDMAESDFGNEVSDGGAVLSRLETHLQAAESGFEDRTDTAFVPTRVGFPDTPASYEYQSGTGGGRGGYSNPVKVFLDEMNVLPFDPNQGDRLEMRTGPDKWRDITNAEGDEWRADYQKGVIEILRPHRGRISLWGNYGDNANQAAFRMTYRYGALGGDHQSGGQTTLTADITDTATDLPVDATERLPYGESTVLLGNEEYVEVVNDGDTLTANDRGVRNTEATSHDSSASVHFCPLNIREAIAAKAAVEALRQEDTIDVLIDTGDRIELNSRISTLEDRWESTISRHEDTFGYT